jgi:osmotically-inducible protein OsmY
LVLALTRRIIHEARERFSPKETAMLTTATKTDAQIKNDVTAELKWEPRVNETHIGVQVENGVVTLTGSVTTYAEKASAQEAAHRVHGVHDVANDIEVRTPGTSRKSDAEVASAVRSALEWDALVPDDKIHCTITNGWVTLTGVVDRWSEREDAARAIRNLSGVQGVTNNITIEGPAVSPERIRTDIKDALQRQAEREAEHIDIDVADGIVTVSGKVRTWAEKRAVRGVVGCAPGVRAIEDDLIVDPLQ